jgi:hypothetical protein
MKRTKPFFQAALSLCVFTMSAATAVRPCRAQDATNVLGSPNGGFFADWFDRVSRIQAQQPKWMTPVFTTTPRLDEEFHYDLSFQSSAAGHLDNFGSAKGLELIPWYNLQVNMSVPPWISRDKPSDGFGDESFLVKYRWLAANRDKGDYILTTFLGLTVPTGSKRQTSDRYTLTPTIAGGKGWGEFNIQSTLGIPLPSNDGTSRRGPGTPLAWSTSFQYQLAEVVWPEVEANYTYWPNGSREGNNQLFIAPGLLFGRFPIWRRLRMVVGLGYQVAVTDKPQYHNNLQATVRFPF